VERIGTLRRGGVDDRDERTSWIGDGRVMAIIESDT
jgi:hypothetical protein